LLHFSFPEEVINWKQHHQDSVTNCLYLVDYEFLGQSLTGLQLIQKLSISKNSILVTSKDEEKDIREQCSKLNVKLLPKGLAPYVSFSA